MGKAFNTTRRIEFRDTDAAGIMHFSAFFVLMEQAEHEFLRHLGLSVLTQDEHGLLTWPRVAARCDYQGSARFEDVLDIEVKIVRLGTKSVTYEFSFTHDGRAVAAGQMTSVCCRFDERGVPHSVPMPSNILAQLKPAAAE